MSSKSSALFLCFKSFFFFCPFTLQIQNTYTINFSYKLSFYPPIDCSWSSTSFISSKANIFPHWLFPTPRNSITSTQSSFLVLVCANVGTVRNQFLQIILFCRVAAITTHPASHLSHLLVGVWVESWSECWASSWTVLREKPSRFVTYATSIAKRLWTHRPKPPLWCLRDLTVHAFPNGVLLRRVRIINVAVVVSAHFKINPWRRRGRSNLGLLLLLLGDHLVVLGEKLLRYSNDEPRVRAADTVFDSVLLLDRWTRAFCAWTAVLPREDEGGCVVGRLGRGGAAFEHRHWTWAPELAMRRRWISVCRKRFFFLLNQWFLYKACWLFHLDNIFKLQFSTNEKKYLVTETVKRKKNKNNLI